MEMEDGEIFNFPNRETRDILPRNEHRNRLSRLLSTPSFSLRYASTNCSPSHESRNETAPLFIQPVCLPVTILRQSRFHKRCVLYVDPGNVPAMFVEDR